MKKNLMRKSIVVVVLFAAICCKPSSAASGDASAKGNAFLAASAKPSATKVKKIVFVGKKHACPCTRRAIDAGWAALQKALGTPAKLPVERLQIDTEGEKVAPYRKQKPMMTLPAIYFVDGKNVVLDLLQGEITVEQISAVIRAKRIAP